MEQTMKYDTFKTKFPFNLFEAEEKPKEKEDEEKEDAPKFPKKTKVDLEPEEEIVQHN